MPTPPVFIGVVRKACKRVRTLFERTYIQMLAFSRETRACAGGYYGVKNRLGLRLGLHLGLQIGIGQNEMFG